MNRHITGRLSAYLNHELPKDERQTIAEHLLLCEKCRSEYDRIKLGAALASQLKRADTPVSVWNKIESALDGKEEKTKISLFTNFAFFSSGGFVAMACSLIAFGLIAAVYFGFLRNSAPEDARNETPIQKTNVEMPEIVLTPAEALTNQNVTAAAQKTETNSAMQIPPIANSNVSVRPQIADSNVRILPKVAPVQPLEALVAQNNLPAWKVQTIDGAPQAGNQKIAANGKLAVGEFLETDADSRAKIQVADIGQVEVAPNSRVQLVKTSAKEHRLSLTRGRLQAKILAPPRLFIVDTPSAVAVDLGCEYTLEVDREGNSKLHVTSGFVALERGRRESIVPAGAIALTKKGKGLGTPFSDDSSVRLQNALYQFDFANGGAASLQTIIKESNLYDALTLWHLLSRVAKNEREKVFDALASRVKPPSEITKQGVLRLDKKMLDAWWMEIENVWFE